MNLISHKIRCFICISKAAKVPTSIKLHHHVPIIYNIIKFSDYFPNRVDRIDYQQIISFNENNEPVIEKLSRLMTHSGPKTDPMLSDK